MKKLNDKGITLATTIIIICILLFVVVLVTILTYNFERETEIDTLHINNYEVYQK